AGDLVFQGGASSACAVSAYLICLAWTPSRCPLKDNPGEARTSLVRTPGQHPSPVPLPEPERGTGEGFGRMVLAKLGREAGQQSISLLRPEFAIERAVADGLDEMAGPDVGRPFQ